MALCLAVGCSYQNETDEQRLLQGAWLLRQVEYPYDVPDDTLSEQEGTALLLYDGDSVVYQCWMTKTESGLVVRPGSQRAVTLIDKGGGEQVYIEGDNPRPLTIVDDSTIVIQRDGVRYTYRRADDMAVEWGTDIRNIVAANAGKNNSEEKPIYVLSAKERQQASYIQWLLATIVMIVVLAVANNVVARRRRRQLQLQLQQIQEVRQERSQTVRQAMESVETAFFASDRYEALQRRIATGQRLKDSDWQEIEAQVRKVYPGFASQLRGLHAMSELEYQVCLLIKLRIVPKDIAAVLARDMSTISTVRSRLYKKVFGQKGGAREWDEFILSIGA